MGQRHGNPRRQFTHLQIGLRRIGVNNRPGLKPANQCRGAIARIIARLHLGELHQHGRQADAALQDRISLDRGHPVQLGAQSVDDCVVQLGK